MMDRVATAKEALDIGLINRCVAVDQVDAEVHKIVAKLQSYNPVGTKLTKRWLNQYMCNAMNITGMGSLCAEGMVFSHEDFAKKVEAYAKSLEQANGYKEAD